MYPLFHCHKTKGYWPIYTHTYSLKKQVDWQSNYMLSSLVLFFNSTIDMQHIKLKLVYFKSKQHKKPGGMRLSQWLTILTEYVGSHDGFLRCNKSDEVLESFLTPPNQEKKHRVNRCKLLMPGTLKVYRNWTYSNSLTTKLGEGNEHVILSSCIYPKHQTYN